MHGTYVGHGRVLIATTFGAKLLASSDDLSLMPELVVAGGYDEPFTNLVRRTLSSGHVAIDVGANIGLFTMLMAWQVGPSGSVLSYECEPRNVALLRETVAMNYATWVELHDTAVGAAAGTATFYRTSRFQGNASLVEHDADYRDRFGGVDTVEPIEVEVVPLDDQLGRFEQIDLIKIDVEGAENEVLAGMRQLLKSRTVTRISMEISRDRADEAAWDALTAQLAELHADGWQYSTIARDGSTSPLSLDTLIDIGHFSQVLLDRPATAR